MQQRFHGRIATTTAMVTLAAVYGHAVVFPSVFLCPLHDFYFLSVPSFSFLCFFFFFFLHPAFLGFLQRCALRTARVGEDVAVVSAIADVYIGAS